MEEQYKRKGFGKTREDDRQAAYEVVAEEFSSEIGSIGVPNIEEDDYVGPDGKPRAHQAPGEVREETDRILDRRFEHSENIQELEHSESIQKRES